MVISISEHRNTDTRWAPNRNSIQSKFSRTIVIVLGVCEQNAHSCGRFDSIFSYVSVRHTTEAFTASEKKNTVENEGGESGTDENGAYVLLLKIKSMNTKF